MNRWRWLAWLLGIAVLAMLPACAGPGLLRGAGGDIKDILESPAIQATLQEWSARSDVTNPRVSGVLGTIFELRADGIIIRSAAAGGASTPGINPETLKALKDDTTPKHFADLPAAGGG